MGRQGWNKVTFKAGDEITAVAHPLKDGSKGASLFYVILPDGKPALSRHRASQGRRDS